MRKNKFFSSTIFGLMAGVVIGFSGCSDDDDDPKFEGNQDREYFNVILGVGDDGNDGVYAQALEDVSTGSISFNGYGYEIPADRTARVCASEDGKYVFSLDYGGGTITKFRTNGGQSYTQINKIDVSLAIGSTNPRWGKVNDEMALLHNITTERKYKDEAGTEYDYTAAYANLAAVKLGSEGANLELGAVQKLEIPQSDEDKERNLNIWRIDAPVVANGKVYYGVAKRSYDPETNANVTVSDYSTTTLVADYPSLDNLTTIESGVCTGENYGYRTPAMHVDEKGDVYQVVGNGQKAYMLKIKNGAYDDSYKLDLSAKIGYEVGALGWFYIGNGIGYVLFYDLEQGQAEAESAWAIARVDIYNNTAVKMNIPYKLWLRQYQSGVLKNGKFYMALAPVGEEGAIYMFDPSSTSADAFEKGATLDNLAGQFFIGVY